MKKKHGMDIYIVDQSNTVVYTTFTKDIGLDFSRCCQRFSALLDERRASGEFLQMELIFQHQQENIENLAIWQHMIRNICLS